MLFSYHYGQQQIENNKKCMQIADDFICHADAAVQRGAHHPIDHAQGFTRSHWMPDAAIERVPAPYCPGNHHG
jgi:hypothetical protein